MEVCWIYSLKWLDFGRIRAIELTHLWMRWEPWWALLPLLGYIVFGLGNIYFFSLAMKGIAPSTAFAVWMGLALVGTKAIGIVLFNEAWNWTQLLFIALILTGVVGLKYMEGS